MPSILRANPFSFRHLRSFYVHISIHFLCRFGAHNLCRRFGNRLRRELFHFAQNALFHCINLFCNFLKNRSCHICPINIPCTRLVYHHINGINGLFGWKKSAKRGKIFLHIFAIHDFASCPRFPCNAKSRFSYIFCRSIRHNRLHHACYFFDIDKRSNLSIFGFWREILQDSGIIQNLRNHIRTHIFPFIGNRIVKSQHLQGRNLQRIADRHRRKRGSTPIERTRTRDIGLRFAFYLLI